MLALIGEGTLECKAPQQFCCVPYLLRGCTRKRGTRQPRLKLSSPVYQILTLDKLLSLSVPQFLHLSNGIIAEVHMSLIEYKVGLYEALTTYSASYNVC